MHSNVQSMFNCALYSDETSVCRLLHRIDYKGIVSYFHIRHNAKTMESSRFRFLKMLNFYLEYFRCMLVGHYYNYVRFWMDDFIRNCYIAIFQFLYRIPGRCWNSWEYANNPSYVSNSVLLLLNQDDHNFELPSMRTILNNNNSSYIFTTRLFCRARFNSSPTLNCSALSPG